MLLLALSTLFPYSIDKGYFHRPGSPDWHAAKTLAIAENLSPDHRFRLFRGWRQGPGGAPTYEMYSRFPVGGYALVKLAILPFGNDLSARILAARMLMLLLFSGAALLAFHALARITSRPWVALAATLTAFSSYYMLFYGDMVSVEFSMDLFAVMLVFHGMVVFVQEGRFLQLLARTGVALLLGWHVYAFLLPFTLLGLACEAVRVWKGGTAVWPRVRSTGAALLRSRYAALGMAALLFGMAVLGFNFANEYAAFGGEASVTELPSVKSMLRRTGLNQALEAHEWWLRFLRGQLFRVCVASVPFMLSDWGSGLLERLPSLRFLTPELPGPRVSVYLLALLAVAGAGAALIRLAGPLLEGRQRLLLAALALSGFCWALPMRYNAAQHSHEAMYYVGVPLVFYSLLLLYVHKRWGHRPVAAFAAAALLAFVASAFQMDRRWRPDARLAEDQRAAMAELGAIRETTRGKAVTILDSANPEREWSGQVAWPRHIWNYYFAENVLTHSPDAEDAAPHADFIVAYDRVESDALLTPGNRHVFLYDSAGAHDLLESYRSVYQQVVSAGDPVVRSRFDVYLGDDALAFVKEPCVWKDTRPRPIFVAVAREDPEELPRWRLRYEFDNSGISRFPVLFEGKCIAVFPLPDYPASRIRAGQDRLGPLRSWTVEIDL